MRSEKRVVILTGASQGIGRATAYALARAGCRLVLAARGAIRLQQLAMELNAQGYTAIAIPTDMGDTTQAAALAHKTVAIFGTIDVIINNAGIGVYQAVAELDETAARQVMEVNYFGPVALIQAALPTLMANPDGGLIINISSIIGRRAMPHMAAYCATKAALERMAESLRLEVKTANVRVSTVYPGVTATEFVHNSLGDIARLRPNRRAGVPAEWVAQAILQTIRYERRDVFITLFDRAFVTFSMIFPYLADQILFYYTRIRN